MDALRIQGGTRLSGTLEVDGSKNAALPAMAAAILSTGEVTLRDIPTLSDIGNMVKLLRELGCEVTGQDRDCTIRTIDASATHARYDIVRTMRASICVLGPLLAARGEARVSMPGGCAIGDRPVDLHLRGLEALGATIELDGGDIIARAKRLRGATIFLGGPFGSTVLGTANVMSAAVLAEGRTVIESAACEPEISGLADMLNAMGANISGAGTPRIEIEGVESLGSVDYRIIPDRIVAGTLAMGVAMTNGEATLTNFPYDNLLAVLDRLNIAGVHVTRTNPEEDPKRCSVHVTSERRLEPVLFTTQPYPGFPTDLQAQMMAIMCLADGNSIVTERIYPDRFLHVSELTRMGATLFRSGPTVVVQGGDQLIGAPVMASDLRGSAALVMAGLVARGETIVQRVYHLDRGYVRLEEQFNALGAGIERFDHNPAESIEAAEIP
ncbi:MAG: UDP-N-acetylglucosamine 1-carboxyvinyltransferase [Planctomycetes bacterium]|jgi:UDP-N-acetylglucosamine 1-carboxyvinyltransferase|nr:UDP-N-acetylglucosamine 1-carboxyvinyltransferase [Planctomycetota bacterium]MCP4839684.1 UDP-N-acetylglucosamine 1-carboxyvinyltransferase [Planctomycetota bacterium]